MPQVFGRRWNNLSRVSLLGLFVLVALVSFGAILWTHSSYGTGTAERLIQPVPFSHEHHAGILQIDCRYCHTTVERSSFAGIPPTSTCMNCHSQMWAASEMLEPVRQSFKEDEPLRWQRVHNTPGFVYFDHSVHIHNGVGCSSCHGRVDLMPFVHQQHSLLMQWCIDCHRAPASQLRPPEDIFNMDYEFPENQEELGRELMRRYDIKHDRQLTSCSVCHR